MVELLNGWKEFTISFWIYPDYNSDAEWQAAGETRVFYKSTSVSFCRFWRYSWMDPGEGYLQMDLNFGTGTEYESVPIYRAQWNHIVYSFDGNRLREYSNGELDNSFVIGDTKLVSDSSDFSLGYYSDTFKGYLDEFQILQTGKTTDWVATHYANIINTPQFYSLGDEEQNRNWWADATFAYRRDIIIDHNEITGDLANFTMLFDYTSSSFKSGTISIDANDILFVDEYHNKLAHEIDYFTQSSSQGRLIAWVKIPYVYSTTDTIISLYYKSIDPLDSQENSIETWKEYSGIWHLGENPSNPSPQFYDSTGNLNYGIASSLSSSNQVLGKIDGSLQFDDTNERHAKISDSSSLKLSADIYLAAWVKTTDNDADVGVIAGKWGSLAANRNYWLGKLDSSTIGFYVDNTQYVTTNLNLINNDIWHYVVGVADSFNGKLYIYVDGILRNSANYDGSSVTGSSEFHIGNSPGEIEQEWNGIIDEVQVGGFTASNSLIKTSYNNQIDPGNFVTVSSERDYDVTPPEINDFGIDDIGTGIGTFWSSVSDNVAGVNSVTVTINGTDHSMSYNGTFWIYQTSVDYGATYEYQITNASDMRENYITSPSIQKNHTFSADTVSPDVVDWEYYPELGLYGTFKANVTDSWGEIDVILVNVTKSNGVPRNDLWAIMRPTASDYMNDTIVMDSGPIYYEIIVNDTAGNSFTSSEHQGFVPIVNHPPEVSDLTLSRVQYSVLLPIYSNSTLYLNYTFYDQDNDDEGGTEIRWYKNGVLQSLYNNQKSIPTSALIRGDAWNATVKPKDGQVFGTLVASETVIIQNTPPKITTVTISPSTPLTTQQLIVTNITSDDDGDILTFEVKWFNPSENSSYMNLVVINSDQTKKGETWWCEVRAWDGTNYSSWKISNSVTIQNSAPSASSLIITPSSAFTTDDLHATYLFTDADDDPESSSYIRWFKNGVEQPAYENLTTVPASATLKGQNWYFIVQPYDGVSYGTQKQSVVKTIENTPPTANNLQITPESATTVTSLTADYNYIDADNDVQSGTKILWYKDGVLQGALNDSSTVSSSYTAKGQVWHFKVQPSDGTDFGIWISCPVNITIQNSSPSASGLQITPSDAKTADTLTATYVYFDADGDPQSGSEIIWYQNGILIGTLNGSITVSSSYTKKDDIWHFKTHPKDGIIFGGWVSCPTNVTIANTAPSASNLEITPTSPITTDVLLVNYNFIDTDSDSEYNSQIRWFKNGIEQSAYENDTSIPAAATKRGENWYFRITPFDGTDYGSEQQSDVVMIKNSPPMANNLYITPSDAKTADTLIAHYDYTDLDNDVQSGTQIIWYKDGVLQGTLNNSISVSSSSTAKGQSWHFKVQPSDGTDFGSWVSCPVNITIQNTAPSASSLQIIPSDAKTSNTLTATYIYSDADGDPQSGSKIIWYRNGILIGVLNDSITVDSSYTTKDDTWHIKVRPYDSFDFGIWYSCPTNLTISNTPPNVENIELNGKNTSAQISVNDDLIVNYDYYDLDGDGEVISSLEILWYRNNVLVSVLNNCLLVGYLNTSIGEVWYFKIKVYDGTAYSTQESSPSVTIDEAPNNPPEALYLNITPSIPLTSDSLYINYTFVDADNDSEDGSIYRWFRNGILLPEYVLPTLPASATAKGDIWHVKVRPRDGTDFGNWVSVPVNVTVGNTAPSASNLVILPSNPTTSNDLQLSYTFQDLDSSDTESGSEIRWFRNGVLQGALNDSQSITSSYTAKGHIWHFKVRPSDGTDFGEWISCPINITVQNTAPSVSTLSITPINAKTQDNLTANYIFTDIDSDGEGDSYIRWYLDGVEQISYENQTTIPNTVTSKGQIWFFTIQPSDGEDLGIERTSTGLTIRNTAPSLSNLEITPSAVTTVNALTAIYSYFDVDTDPQSGTSIHWYKDGVLQGSLNDSLTVSAGYTAKGQIWHIKVRPKDGTEFGSWYNCLNNITIGNALPSANNLQISPSDAKTTHDLVASYIFSDVDSDTETNSAIIWYLNGLEQPLWENQTLIPASSTIKGDIWHFKVCPSDGFDFGNWMSCAVNLTIGNSLPTASSLQISPSYATTNDVLQAIYSYSDADGDIEALSLLRWYKNGIEQPSFENQTIISNTATTKGDNWYFTIQPFDGTELGVLKTSVTITISNSPPSTNNLQFSPLNPTSDDNLGFSYIFTDLDSDILINIEIRWYRNNILQSTYNDINTIDKSILIKGDQWNLSIRVSDGIDYSEWSNITIIILNSAPIVVEFSPQIYVPTAGLFTTSVLSATWDDFDADSDTIVDYYVRWFKYNGTIWYEIFDLENNTEVLPSYTTKDDEWRFRVKVFDGEDWSDWSSDAIQGIDNSEPYVENIFLSGGISTTSNIVLSYDFYDADNDSESSKIEWKIVHLGSVTTIQGSKTLSSSLFTAGDLIWVVITPDDNDPITGVITGKPIDSSTLSGSHVMKLIGNTAPQINTSMGYPLILSDHENGSSIYNPQVPIYLDYANLVFDIDSGESDPIYDFVLEQNIDIHYAMVMRVSGAQYRWYKFNSGSGIWELQPELTKSYIDPYYLYRDEQWMGSVRPRDQYGYFGAWINSTPIKIGNSLPEIIDFSWLLPAPTTLTDLEFYFEYFDYDNDPLELSKTLILWLKNGEVIIGTENTTILYSTYFQKNDIISVILRPFDGSDWALTNFTSPSVVIVNSPPSLTTCNLAPTTISNLEVLALNWIFSDVDGDIEALSQIHILWYLNGLPQLTYTNQTFIFLNGTANGDLWRADCRVSDGFSYSIVYSPVIETRKLTIDYFFDPAGQVDPYTGRVNQFYVEDENLSITFCFDIIGDVSNASIRWFTDQGNNTWLEVIEFENQTEIPSNVTLPGQRWYCSIVPFDGTYTWAHLNSSVISIESRPSIITPTSEIIATVEDTEGHYTFITTVNDMQNSIYAVEYLLNDTLGGIRYAEAEQGTNNWIFDYRLTPSQFQDLLNHLIIVEIKIITQVNYGQFFEIYQTFTMNFTITDAVAPRVTNAFFTNNATSITFYAELQEYGSAISAVSLYYFFEEVSASATYGLGASLTQKEFSVFMSLLNTSALSSLYFVTIPFDGNGTDWKVVYRIETLDSTGNLNPRAYDVQRDDPESVDRNIIRYIPPGLPEWILLVAGAVVLLILIGAVVYVRFIRKPEIIGLDKELVLKGISQISESEIQQKMDRHSIGSVISFFDQRHGPIPIVFDPEILRDNFDKLVDLSDRSFSSTGFSSNFNTETSSSYDFVLDLGQNLLISVVTFGFALEKPEARGGQENLTYNILLYKDLFDLVYQFQEEVKNQVHELHELMKIKDTGKDKLKGKIIAIRKYISRIILSYESIYGTTELITEDDL